VQPNEIIDAYQAFFANERRSLDVVGFFRDVVASVPAYRKFLAYANIDPAAVQSAEDFRQLPMTSKGTYVADPVSDMVSLYGTADAGVLGNETPKSALIRRFLAARPDLARELFGESRLPTLVQYDPTSRFFEVHG
jgi:phenylacetate-coenzyme A ligase PaaK-like adenylate-forming protein